jgi:hypothetical protein
MKAPSRRQAPLDTPTQMWQPFRRRSMEWNDSGRPVVAAAAGRPPLAAGVSHVRKGWGEAMRHETDMGALAQKT